MIRFAPVLLLALAACAAVTASAVPVPLTGDWGGAHIHLSLTANGGTVEYDCAHGTIDEPVVPDSRGRFSAAGTYTREHGGPVRMGEILPSSPARYSGEVHANQMILTVEVSGMAPLGPYRLLRGGSPQVYRCL